MKNYAALLALAVAPILAQQPNPSMLVSTDWLASHLKDESPVILHVGSQKDYDAGHIPGARLVTLADISVTDQTGLRTELPPVARLAETFAKLGVTDSSRVVVYPATDAVRAATRVWFTLDYLGLGDRTSLLDGGLLLWRAQGRPLSTAPPPPAVVGKLTVRPSPDRIVTSDWLRTRLHDPKIDLVDSRPPDSYSGRNPGELPRAGHIPGARNVPQESSFQTDGTLKPAEALRQMLNPSGGQAPGTTVSYCNTGQQATVTYFVGRYLGLDVRLYDGSMQDWTGQPNLPVESSSQAPAGQQGGSEVQPQF